MVEMNETASIINNMSARSLILLDEIGRGTATYDGISIAWSMVEFIHNSPFKPKTLFATHYPRFSPKTSIAVSILLDKQRASLEPDPTMICTSHVERQNLTMRTFLRRLTRLCLGFSKKLENLKHAIALHFAYYNFCRVHRTLRVTPAMEAGITDHVWTLEDILLGTRG